MIAFPRAVALYAAVALGSALGGSARALVSMASLSLFGPGFPWGTLIANVAGSFAIGLFATLAGPGGRLFVGTAGRQLVMTGFCGGFTTFSLFSLETLTLAGSGQWPLAGLYGAVSVAAWLVAVLAGHRLAARLNRLGGS